MEVVAGVTRVKGDGSRAAYEEDADGAVKFLWLRIGDAVLLTDTHGLISAEGRAKTDGFLEVTIRLIADGFRTAQDDGPDDPRPKKRPSDG